MRWIIGGPRRFRGTFCFPSVHTRRTEPRERGLLTPFLRSLQLFSSCQFISNGSLDTVILSKHPILQTNFRRFRLSPIWAAGALSALVDVNGSTINVICTHPVTDAPLVDFADTNQDQVSELVRQVEELSNGTQANVTIVLGDFNSGMQLHRVLQVARKFGLTQHCSVVVFECRAFRG